MRHRRIAFELLAALTLSVCAQSQSNDWEAVKHIPGGSIISVRADHHLLREHCFLLEVTDSGLQCQLENAPGWAPADTAKITFPRPQVRKIWIEHSEAAHRGAGVAITATAGAVLGARAAGPGARVGGAVIGAGVFALFGPFVGDLFHPLPGKLVYRR